MAKTVILCVDDNKIILNSIKAQLKENYGNLFLYKTAESVVNAFGIIYEIIKNLTVKLIISDWLMPGIKGDEFLIKVHSKYPKALKIMLTGQVNTISIEKTKKESSLYKCIRKSWIESELFSCLDSGNTIN